MVVLFLHSTDLFYYVTRATILGDKTTWRNTTKFLVKCRNNLVQQIVQQKVRRKEQQKVQQKVPNNYVALLIKQFMFTKLVKSLY